MGQTLGNGLNNINDAMSDYAAVKANRCYTQYGEPVAERYGNEKDIDLESVLGYKYAGHAENQNLSKTMSDNFDEYMKARQERAKEAGEDEETKKRQEKEEAKEIARNLSEEEIKTLTMMGVDVESASLSDIMGIVNTLRGNAHREQTAQMLAEISAGQGDTDDLSVIGGSVKVAGTDVELQNVSVSDVVINREAAEIGGERKLGDDALIYLLKNNLPMTKENLYKAYYSGGHAATDNVPDSVFQDMRQQIEKVIEQAGYEVDETTLSGAKLLLSHELPLTTDSIKAYMDYQTYAGADPGAVSAPENMREMDDRQAEMLYMKANSIRPETVYDMTLQGKEITIASAYRETIAAQQNMGQTENDRLQAGKKPQAEEDRELLAVTNMRRMEEIRLSMTLEAAGRLVKSDINIDTRELSRVVRELQDAEQALVARQFQRAGLEPTEENLSVYYEMTEKVESLAQTPAAVIATPLSGGDFTVNGLYDAGVRLYDVEDASGVERAVSEKRFETVRRDYEALGTAPRADMGDSITKAFSNVDDILRELDLPVNYETQRAVRILGYNSLELTVDNIEQVMDYDRQVNELMQNFYPEAVLSAIRDGINPLDMPIDELNQVIRDRNYNDGVTEADNFATYLRDMEQRGQVTPEERESYIGIYRVMNRLAKSGDREAGYLFANGSRLTVRNLISAMRSRKAAGIDVAVDDNFGMLEDAGVTENRMDTQIERAFVDRHMEKLTAQVEQFMQENEIEVSMVNVSAVHEMLSSQGGLYQLVSEILSKMHFHSDTKEDMIDDETEHMTDSLTGEEVPLSFEPEHILESLRRGTDMSLTYDDLRSRMTDFMYQAGIAGNLTSMDISSVKVVQAGFRILGSMARKDRYQVPVETAQGIRVVNLTVQHDSENRGTVELHTEGRQMGDVRAKVRLDGAGRLSGYIVSESEAGNYLLAGQEQMLLSKLAQSGYTKCDVRVGQLYSDTADEPDGYTAPEADEIYGVSVALVKAVADILC